MSEISEPLAAAFFSELIRRVRISERETNFEARWIINIGILVQYCDAKERDIFRRVGRVAYEWSRQPFERVDLETLMNAYAKTLQEHDADSSPVSVFPELTAALHEFIRDPNRAEGLYGFCDVGGGTMDGAGFRLNRSGGVVPLSIPSAGVEALGTTAVSRYIRNRGKSRGGMIIRFTEGRESDSMRECRRLPILSAFRTPT